MSSPGKGVPRPTRVTIAGAILVFSSVPLIKSYFARAEMYATGQLQEITSLLRDGSRLELFGETRVEIKITDYERHIDLTKGNIRVEVQKHKNWPFIVHVGNYKVIAVGTNFSVRRRDHQIVVCLREGKVRLEDSHFRQKQLRKFNLTPDQCVTLPEYAPQAATGQEEAQIRQSGSVAMEEKTLSEVTGEINRYSRVPVVLERIDGNQKINGVFYPGDALVFARAMAGVLGLEVKQSDGKIVLYSPEDRNPPARN